MICKFKEWDDKTQAFIKESLLHIIDASGYVVDIFNHERRIDEDYIYDQMEMQKVFSHPMRVDAIKVLNEIEVSDSKESFIIAYVIHYLENNIIS